MDGYLDRLPDVMGWGWCVFDTQLGTFGVDFVGLKQLTWLASFKVSSWKTIIN